MMCGLKVKEKSILENNNAYYTVYVTDGNNRGQNRKNIVVQNKRQLEIVLMCLEDNVNVSMNVQEEIANCDLFYWLYNQSYQELKKELKWTYKEMEEVLEVIGKVSIPDTIEEKLTKNKNLSPIQKEYVHKKNNENVIISEPEKLANMFYFRGFNQSEEIRVDHSSDHLEGIVIFEAARQAGIASVHLLNIPLTGAIIISKSHLEYTKFIEVGSPYYIQTIPVVRQRGGLGFCVFHIIQNNVTCAKGYFSGLLYKTKEDYMRFRRKVHL